MSEPEKDAYVGEVIFGAMMRRFGRVRWKFVDLDPSLKNDFTACGKAARETVAFLETNERGPEYTE